MSNYILFENWAFSNSIQHRATGKMLETLVLPASVAELQNLPGEWLFDWVKEAARYKVFKLVTVENQAVIQGLVSLEERRGFFFVSLVESAPFNRNERKQYDGVGGNLFAFACKLSAERGFGGFISFEAKTELIAYYQKSFGAKVLGNSIRMIIEEPEAAKLIRIYF